MTVWKCNNCNHVMGTRRFLCPECGSESISVIEANEGISDSSTALFSTQNGFPESYAIISYSTSYGTTGFCISQEKIKRGSRIRIFRRDGKIFCESP